MATLVLGIAGRVFLGPVGGIVGSLLGSAVDRAVLGGGRSREVGRMANLAVQASSYGEPIPLVHGRMRVAGNMIWTAGIKESAARSGGGKRGPATTTYSYAASFAVLLAGRAIVDVGRVWADGRLIRDSAGQWLVPVRMRLHRGGEGQAPDALIAAAEGAAPAYRGLAYAVFEDMALGDYGNRIPSLSFEVIADSAPVDMGAVMADLASGAGVALPLAGAFPALAGSFVGNGGSLAEALAPLLAISGAAVGDGLTGTGLPPRALALADRDASRADDDAPGRERQRIEAVEAAPTTMEIGFFDLSRDYQPGLQRVRRGGNGPGRYQPVSAALAPDAAKGLALAQLGRLAAGRQRLTLRLPWRHLGWQPGDRVQLDGAGPVWRVAETRLTGFVLALDLVRDADAALPALPGDGGRAAQFADAAAGPTTLVVMDLPPLPGEVPDAPRLWLAGGGGPGWRRANALVSSDGGTSYRDLGALPGPSVIGSALTALAPASPASWDDRSQVDVALLHDGLWLESADRAAVLAGANLALLGEEIVQFAEVQPLAPGRFRLSGLLRGRRGTEAAVAGHVAGERFVLLDQALLLPVLPPLEAVGQAWQFRAAGPGDADAPAQTVPLAGRGLQPLAPVHVRAERVGPDVVISWRRASRAGFGWPDGLDVPLAEAAERYRVEIWQGASLIASDDTNVPHALVPAPAGPLRLRVAQLGAVPGQWAELPWEG